MSAEPRMSKLLPELCVWRSMIQRCHNPQHVSYSNYGGRGITVCLRWRWDFDNFIEDMGLRTSKLHSIDRIDNDGNYEPGNCRWADRKTQNRNRRNTAMITYRGRRVSLVELADEMNFNPHMLRSRLDNGWSVEDAVETSPKVYPNIKAEPRHSSWETSL